MKRAVCLLLSFLIISCILSACGEKYSPEDAVRNTCFDEYHDSDEHKGKLFGLVMREFIEDSFVKTPSGKGEYLWDIHYTVNNNIPFLKSIKTFLEYNSETEDLVCVTLSEDIDFELDSSDSDFSYIFSVDKSTQKVTPLISINIQNGVLQKDKINDDPQNFMSVLYACLEYWRLNIEYVKENVY